MSIDPLDLALSGQNSPNVSNNSADIADIEAKVASTCEEQFDTLKQELTTSSPSLSENVVELANGEHLAEITCQLAQNFLTDHPVDYFELKNIRNQLAPHLSIIDLLVSPDVINSDKIKTALNSKNASEIEDFILVLKKEQTHPETINVLLKAFKHFASPETLEQFYRAFDLTKASQELINLLLKNFSKDEKLPVSLASMEFSQKLVGQLSKFSEENLNAILPKGQV